MNELIIAFAVSLVFAVGLAMVLEARKDVRYWEKKLQETKEELKKWKAIKP